MQSSSPLPPQQPFSINEYPSLDGFELKSTSGVGDCFFDEILDQMQRLPAEKKSKENIRTLLESKTPIKAIKSVLDQRINSHPSLYGHLSATRPFPAARIDRNETKSESETESFIEPRIPIGGHSVTPTTRDMIHALSREFNFTIFILDIGMDNRPVIIKQANADAVIYLAYSAPTNQDRTGRYHSLNPTTSSELIITGTMREHEPVDEPTSAEGAASYYYQQLAQGNGDSSSGVLNYELIRIANQLANKEDFTEIKIRLSNKSKTSDGFFEGVLNEIKENSARFGFTRDVYEDIGLFKKKHIIENIGLTENETIRDIYQGKVNDNIIEKTAQALDALFVITNGINQVKVFKPHNDYKHMFFFKRDDKSGFYSALRLNKPPLSAEIFNFVDQSESLTSKVADNKIDQQEKSSNSHQIDPDTYFKEIAIQINYILHSNNDYTLNDHLFEKIKTLLGPQVQNKLQIRSYPKKKLKNSLELAIAALELAVCIRQTKIEKLAFEKFEYKVDSDLPYEVIGEREYHKVSTTLEARLKTQKENKAHVYPKGKPKNNNTAIEIYEAREKELVLQKAQLDNHKLQKHLHQTRNAIYKMLTKEGLRNTFMLGKFALADPSLNIMLTETYRMESERLSSKEYYVRTVKPFAAKQSVVLSNKLTLSKNEWADLVYKIKEYLKATKAVLVHESYKWFIEGLTSNAHLYGYASSDTSLQLQIHFASWYHKEVETYFEASLNKEMADLLALLEVNKSELDINALIRILYEKAAKLGSRIQEEYMDIKNCREKAENQYRKVFKRRLTRLNIEENDEHRKEIEGRIKFGLYVRQEWLVDKDGNTLLHKVTAHLTKAKNITKLQRIIKLIDLLLEHGANIYVRNNNNELACDIAKLAEIAEELQLKELKEKWVINRFLNQLVNQPMTEVQIMPWVLMYSQLKNLNVHSELAVCFLEAVKKYVSTNTNKSVMLLSDSKAKKERLESILKLVKALMDSRSKINDDDIKLVVSTMLEKIFPKSALRDCIIAAQKQIKSENLLVLTTGSIDRREQYVTQQMLKDIEMNSVHAKETDVELKETKNQLEKTKADLKAQKIELEELKKMSQRYDALEEKMEQILRAQQRQASGQDENSGPRP
jgi:hypothetical protein